MIIEKVLLYYAEDIYFQLLMILLYKKITSYMYFLTNYAKFLISLFSSYLFIYLYWDTIINPNLIYTITHNLNFTIYPQFNVQFTDNLIDTSYPQFNVQFTHNLIYTNYQQFTLIEHCHHFHIQKNKCIAKV